MKNNSVFTLHNDCLPHPQPLSKYQLSLIAYLEEVVPKNPLIPELFFENLVRALVLFGDCRGLAHICRDGGGTVLCRWLRSEIALSFDTRQQESHIRKQFLILADQIDFTLLALREDPRWQLLFETPHPSRNRLINFQLRISDSDAFNLLSARLHQGICAKTKQLRHLDTATFNNRLGGFVQPLVRIVRNIPADSVRKSLHEYSEGEFDHLIETVIYTLPRNKIGLDGRSTYAPKTLRKYYSGWIASFYGTASEKAFVKQKYRHQRSSYINPIDPARADELSESHPLREAFLKFVDQQDQCESVDLGITISRPTSSKDPRRLGGAGMGKISKGKAATLFMPSSTMPGVLSITAIAMIMEGIDRLAEFVSEIECSAARILLDLMVHTGRRPGWLLTLQIGNFPNSVWGAMQPSWPIGSRLICHVPKIYASPPTRALGESTTLTNYKIDESAAVHERINMIHQIPIPQHIAFQMQRFLQIRNRVIDNNPEAAGHLKCSQNSGLFFITERDQDLMPLSKTWVDNLLDLLTALLQESIPDHPRLRVTHFSRSFEGFYASFGLRGVYRYYLSGRASRVYEMPLKYSLVSVKDIDAEYSAANAHLNELIDAEAQALFGGIHRKLSIEDPAAALEHQQHGEAFFGSTRVPSRAILREILGSLHADIEQAEISKQSEARFIALTRLAVVALGLFNGLRPFEVTRLKARSFDLESCAVTVKGKARWGKQGYRCIPLLPGIVSLISETLDILEENPAPGKRVFSVYQEESGRRKPMSTKNLDQILESAAVAAGWASGPIFYGLRHRFRTDMLSMGVAEANINFLMGHEIIGQETYSIYSEQRYERLREQYLEAAGKMAHRYGFR